MIKAYYTGKTDKWASSPDDAETFSTHAAAEKVRSTLKGMTQVLPYPGKQGGNFVIVLTDQKRWWEK